jgi:hypothetical protein
MIVILQQQCSAIPNIKLRANNPYQTKSKDYRKSHFYYLPNGVILLCWGVIRPNSVNSINGLCIPQIKEEHARREVYEGG